MPGIAMREFRCNLCRRPFLMLSGDLMFPQPRVCDDCLRAVWDMEDADLTAHVEECFARGDATRAGDDRSPGDDMISVADVVGLIMAQRQQWGTAEEAIEWTPWMRGDAK